MGVRFARRYCDITRDLSNALQGIRDVYAFTDMPADCWHDMTAFDRQECILTLADDVFYALGAVPMLRVGTGWVRYDGRRHVIVVTSEPGYTQIIGLT
ncbi:MAG: hypothetical protein WBH35_04655 [Bacillota bacterium]|jgi:hypothetical protein|nr:hypothetical protein [Bacillota bacterium]HOB90689.1 hypothetical protein [Bacillota bacterium]HPZ53466.1 hypothetical protein [Bacillota bacterium]HQD18808.1 hypothetical protein [Bacillota bacterium]